MKLENGAAGARASILEGLTLLVLGFRITLILDSVGMVEGMKENRLIGSIKTRCG